MALRLREGAARWGGFTHAEPQLALKLINLTGKKRFLLAVTSLGRADAVDSKGAYLIQNGEGSGGGGAGRGDASVNDGADRVIGVTVTEQVVWEAPRAIRFRDVRVSDVHLQCGMVTPRRAHRIASVSHRTEVAQLRGRGGDVHDVV